MDKKNTTENLFCRPHARLALFWLFSAVIVVLERPIFSFLRLFVLLCSLGQSGVVAAPAGTQQHVHAHTETQSAEIPLWCRFVFLARAQRVPNQTLSRQRVTGDRREVGRNVVPPALVCRFSPPNSRFFSLLGKRHSLSCASPPCAYQHKTVLRIRTPPRKHVFPRSINRTGRQ